MIRLDRLLGTLNVCPRSQARELVRAGRVRVNGAPARDAAMPVPEGAAVAVDGQALDTRLARHVMMHKPAGVLTAARDARAQTVMDLLPPVYRSLGCMPVGRLDKDTRGLLLLTTDGQLAHRLLAPGQGVLKEYRAVVEGRLTAQDVAAFAAGVALSDFTARPAQLDILCAREECSTALIRVHEGKFHQVKRMCAARGHAVLSLERLAFGPLRLDDALAEGGFRELTEEERAALYRAAARSAP